MTYSLGFRAPSQRELAADWFQHLVSLCDERRLPDPHDPPPLQASHLSGQACAAAAGLLADLPTAESPAFAQWFGCYMTEPKAQFQILPPDRPWNADDLEAWLAAPDDLVRHPAARMAWREDGTGVWLFVQGTARQLPPALAAVARTLADSRRLNGVQIRTLLDMHDDAATLLLDLVNDGIFETETMD